MTEGEARDRVEIAECVQRYGLALDGRDFALLDRVFTADARLRYAMPGAPGGEGAGGAQAAEGDLALWKRLFAGFLAPFVWTQHLVSTPVVELEDDRARSTCRLVATHAQRRRGGGRSVWVVYGTYRDRWRRTPEGWRICEREFEGAHQEGRPLGPDEVEPVGDAG